jgi:hypothetical protein
VATINDPPARHKDAIPWFRTVANWDEPLLNFVLKISSMISKISLSFTGLFGITSKEKSVLGIRFYENDPIVAKVISNGSFANQLTER